MNDINLICMKKDSDNEFGAYEIKVEHKKNQKAQYKFLIGQKGCWETLKDFSSDDSIMWYPKEHDRYMLMAQITEENSNRCFDHVLKIEFDTEEAIEKEQTNIYSYDKPNKLDKKNNDEKLKQKLKVIIDRDLYYIGEKVFVKVITSDENLMYRYSFKQKDEWVILKEYSLDDSISFTVTEEGDHTIRVESRTLNSTKEFDNEYETEVHVKNIEPLKITNLQCISKDLIIDSEMFFQVDAKYDNERVILYKFFKIDSKGNSVCLQDYTTKKLVSYTEKFPGKYKLLCLTKDLYSVNEFDDRAILEYTVKPYNKVEIHKFTTDVYSPQACGSEIALKVFATGGNKLLYRYKIKGAAKKDTGFINSNTYIWKPEVPGNYFINVQVKDESFEEKYEDSSELEFFIDNNKVTKVTIDDVICNKKDNILVGENIFIEVITSGGFDTRYSFILKKDGKEINSINYGINNWVNFTPEEKGKYELEIKVRDKYSNREYDSHSIVYFDVHKYIPANIDYVLIAQNKNYIVGDDITAEIIVKDTITTLTKYKLYINDRFVEESEYSNNSKYKFNTLCSGKYSIEFYAKNGNSIKQYDSKKTVFCLVNDAPPITNSKIVCSDDKFMLGNPTTIKVKCEGGKEVIYEFYLMENGAWNLVQNYSKKNYYTFIPFKPEKYKLMALCKSMNNNKSYEDFCDIEILPE